MIRLLRVWLGVFALAGSVAFGQSAQSGDPSPVVEKALAKALEATGTERIRLLVECLTLSRKNRDVPGEGISLLFLANAKLGTKDHAQSLGHFEEALKKFEQIKFLTGQSVAHAGIGLVLYAARDHRRAVSHYLASAAIAEKIPDESLVGNAFSGAGIAQASTGDHPQAIKYYRRALEVHRKLKDVNQIAATLNNIAISLGNVGERQEAIKCLEEALPLAEALRIDDLIIKTYNNYGLLYELLGDHSRAVVWLEKSLALARTAKNQAMEATALCNLAFYLGVQGDLERSLAYNRQAVELFVKIGDFSLLPTLFNNIGLAEASSGKLEDALVTLQKALDLHRKSGERHGQSIALMNLGAAAMLLGKRDQARTYLLEALSLARIVGNTAAEANTLSLVAATYEEKDTDVAIVLLKVAVNRLQTLRADVAQLEKGTRDAYKKTIQGPYLQLADLLVRRGRLPEAQQVLDLLKLDELAHFIASRRGTVDEEKANLNSAETDWQARYDAIAHEIGRLGERYSEALTKVRSSSPTEADRESLKKLEADIEVVRKRFTTFLSADASSFSKAGASEIGADIRNTASLKQTLRKLGEQTGSRTIGLYTVTAEERLHIIIITPELQDVVTVPIKAVDLRKKVFDYRKLLQRPDLDPRPLGKELYDLLIAPVEAKLGDTSKAWLWSLDGCLRYLPIASLWSGEQYAVERQTHTVITPAGGADLAGAPDPWKAIAFGASQAQAWSVDAASKSVSFPALPGVPSELSDIGKSIPTDAFLDDRFTREAFFAELQLGKHSVVHVATHFRFEAGNDEASFLLLGKGGGLRFSEVSAKVDTGIFDRVELLTLSACETALSSDADGRDFEGLAALAQRGGVRSVIASLWPVSDDSTRALMARFYANRGDTPKLTKAEALRQAQLALMKGELGKTQSDVRSQPTGTLPDGPNAPPYPKELPAWSHPFYWAPFVLLGNPR